MAENTVAFLLEYVSQLQKSYADLISGAEDELQLLKTELGLLRAFLEEVAKNPKKEEPFREMERQIRGVILDIEDTIDSCLVHAAAAARGKKSLSRGLNRRPVNLAQEVRSLREDKLKPMFDKAKMDFANMKIGDGTGTSLEEPQTKVKKAAAAKGKKYSPQGHNLEFLEQEVRSLRKDKVKPMLDMYSANMKIGDGSSTSLEETQAKAKKAAKGNKSLPWRGFNLKLPFSVAQEVGSLGEDKVMKPTLDGARRHSANMKIGDGFGTNPDKQLRKFERLLLTWQQMEVGFQDEEEVLIKYLMEGPKEELDIISIISMPIEGLASKLASKIYDNQKIQYEFPTCIWVEVSQVFNRKDVFLKILKHTTNRDVSSLSDHELADTVRECLKEGKFLLVMNDVWSVENWNAIRDALPKTNGMGKVLITSCDIDVGRHANHTREPHSIRFLTAEESWQLLESKAFGNLNDCPSELECVGEHAARKCDGEPLAITVTKGILADRKRRKNRQFLRTNSQGEELCEIINESHMVGENLNTNLTRDMEQGISDQAALCYDELPYELRDCFLYLGVFPEDYEISAWTLTRLWIAEGFVRPKVGQSLEETAEENLEDLVRRNLVMLEKTNPEGKVKTCRVPNDILTFCNYKAAEQNLFQKIKVSSKVVFDPPPSDTKKHHRLCIHSHLSEFLSENLNCPGVRSFLCFYKERLVLHPEHISTIADAFNLLRVLESQSIKFTRFPMKFTKNLIHLKYLSLSCDDLDVLPETISELWNLQTLLLETESPSLEVRANIWRMIQLRHLKTKAAIILARQGEGNAGGNLQTLSRLSPEYCTKEVFNRAPNLKRLGIRGKLATLFDVDAECLKKLDRLEKLKLVNDLFYESVSRNRLNGLPPSNCFPPYLESLTLSATFLDWTHMSTLGKINTLEVLKLKNNAFRGESWKADGDGFRSLEFLLIASTDLVFWEVSTDDFPSLRFLVLKNCEKLNEIPLGLTKSLQKLDIDRLGKSAVESARKIKEEKERMKWGGLNLSVGPGCE